MKNFLKPTPVKIILPLLIVASDFFIGFFGLRLSGSCLPLLNEPNESFLHLAEIFFESFLWGSEIICVPPLTQKVVAIGLFFNKILLVIFYYLIVCIFSFLLSNVTNYFGKAKKSKKKQ